MFRWLKRFTNIFGENTQDFLLFISSQSESFLLCSLPMRITSLKFIFQGDDLEKNPWRKPGRTFISKRHRERIQVPPRRTLVSQGQNFFTMLSSLLRWIGEVSRLAKRMDFKLFLELHFRFCKDLLHKDSFTSSNNWVAAWMIWRGCTAHPTTLSQFASLYQGEDLQLRWRSKGFLCVLDLEFRLGNVFLFLSYI